MTHPSWNAAQARDLYNMPQWGEGYFDVSAQGRVVVRPHPGRPDVTIDLFELARRLPREGLDLPVLVRFADILHDRVDALTGAFAEVIGELGYEGGYTAVYPIKVNQQGDVVEQIVRHGGDRVGLEAGSKPELAAVLGLARPGSIVVCNGYKDRGYIRRALIGQKLGHKVYIVVEKLSELPLVIDEARALDVEPLIGLRVRLSANFTSTQQNTGGEKAKFGLTSPQILEAVEMLRAAGRLDAVQMVHFHLGSQVANVQDVAKGLREAARYYVELRRLGAPVDVVDVGGGLGVDYEGTRSRSFCSMNYSLREYARNILRTLQEACAESGEPQPNVISESGRALTAHHAVLIADVIDRDELPSPRLDAPDDEAPAVLHELHALFDQIDAQGPIETLHDAAQFFGDAQVQYTMGLLSLPQRAWAERAYYALAHAVLPKLDPGIRAQREAVEELREKLAAKYFCNFSVFQSVPDAWAIDQVFPIVPIHRLDERPEVRARLCDLTCDSDGRLDQYVDREGLMPTLALHALREGEPYLIGFFMVGAYQEILGDMHNLFGDTNAVNVVLGGADGWTLEGAEHGDRTDELLRYVHLEPEKLAATYREKLDRAGLPAAEAQDLLQELESGLSGYTYLSA
ncbi:biosynthetic arginine decarboxylase [Sinimarinibacterium flocculans]|uniref:Biosynthetic arginine decarboxylase n=1 Tax=Sinimarinibacterium flocculans TaxID=985250 RepID=A0A318E2D3_9GAMM|nr:biosynthetic arginine decarboxylase [Sinimarinibacterium flocculans]PXV63636.1 arginine decarboxylase [Sinimarinibacterium flocculans]